MKRYILEITEQETFLISEKNDETIWESETDDNFDGDPTDEEAVTDYLMRKEIIESADEIVEVVDETGEYETLDEDEDEDEDEEPDEDDDD